MMDSTAPEAPPKINFTELNVRQEQGKPHFIRLHDSVVKRLEQRLTAAPQGLLLGAIEASENCTIAVEDFEPVAKLEESVRAWKPRAGSQQKLVGYYRTQAGSEFALDSYDRAMFERCFPKDSRVLLLVEAPSSGFGMAMFFLGENGRLQHERSTVEFPFNLRELGAEDAPEPAAKPVEVATPKPAAVPTPALAAAVAKKSGGSSLFLKVAVASGVVIASVFGLSELRMFDRPAAQPAPAVASETPAPPAESQPEVNPPEDSTDPVEPAKAVETKPEPRPIESRTQPVKAPAPAAKLDVLTPAGQPTKPPTTLSTPAPVLTAENKLPAPLAQQSVPEPTRAQTPQPTAPPTAIERPSTPRPAVAPPPVASASAPKAVEPVDPITPPHAIRQFSPVIPDNVRRNMSGEVVVKLKVSVDATGKVTGAEPVSDGGAASDAVASAAIAAVKRWQFEPARKRGANVPGEVTLSFTFRK